MVIILDRDKNKTIAFTCAKQRHAMRHAFTQRQKVKQAKQ